MRWSSLTLIALTVACAPPREPGPPPPPVDGGAPEDDAGAPPAPVDAGPPAECPEEPSGDPSPLTFVESSISAPNLDNDAAFGFAYEQSGEELIVGAAGQGERGAAFVFDLSDLVVTAVLEPSTGATNEDLSALAAAPGLVVLGSDAQNGDRGLAWWFEDTGAGYVERGELSPIPQTAPRERFGVAADASADGQVVVIAASAQRVDGLEVAGAVHVFRRIGDEFVHAQQVVSPAPNGFEQFGLALALDEAGTFLLVGAPQVSAPGKLHTFVDGGAGFVHVQTLSSPDPVNTDAFAGTLDLDESRALVGDPRPANGGQVWRYTRCGDQLSEVEQVIGPEVVGGDAFGATVRLTATGALIGRFGFLDRFVIEANGSWTYVQEIEPIGRVSGDGFGFVALELEPGRILAGRAGLTGGEIVDFVEFQ